uniref:Uncharacterized protein n=1 Tax=Sciurus vulgaris TaxID=55149 RepID=A0A8D2B1F6_SCIVU
MAGRPAGPASRPPEPGAAAPNAVARVSRWADDHLRLVQSMPSTVHPLRLFLLLQSRPFQKQHLVKSRRQWDACGSVQAPTGVPGRDGGTSAVTLPLRGGLEPGSQLQN